MVRRVLLVALLIALGLILVPRLFKRYPVQAIVNAPAVELRSPVESVVLGTQPSTGRFEASPVEVLQLQPRMADQLSALREQEVQLSRRLGHFMTEEKKRLEQELVAREGELKRAELDLASFGRELQRQQGLVSAGFISAAQIDSVQLRQESAVVQRDIARANVQRARANLDALVRQGFMGERAGGVDVSYTQQKLDEVRLRIAELQAWSTRISGEANATLLTVRTPGPGLVMGPYVTAGAFAAPGDLLGHYVLCDKSFVDLAVPVSHLADYRQGGALSFRVSGEWNFYQGQVMQIFPLYQSAQKLALAVQPESSDSAGMARVWVQPEPAFLERMRSESNCMMGQRLHAQLPHRSSWMPAWASFLADVF